LCGYSVDAYDKNKNLVVEYDESHHNQPKRKEKDIKRQEEIIKTLHCKFYRYNEVLDKLYEVKLL
jgi:very-short-patch-repair endonuclease